MKNNNTLVSKLNRITKEAEILSLMEESNKNKEWLKRQIKKKALKFLVKLSMNSFQILNSCPDSFIDDLLDTLKGKDLDDLGDIDSFTRTFFWFFTDIVAGSNPTIASKDQARKVVVLNKLIARTETFQNRDPNSTVILPTGDGMAIGFSDSPEYPLRLSIQLHKSLTEYNKSKRKEIDKVLLRIGIDIGPVYIIKDLNEQDNVWGPGIILTRRVMDLAGNQNIFCSSRYAEDVRVLSPEYKEIMHPIGNYSIKHGEQLNIFNIYGDGFGEKNTPKTKKITKKSETFEETLKSKTVFLFNAIDIKLDVLDPKTMLTHHVWKWNLINLSDSPRDEIFYYLDGDSPKDLADMNVKVYDESGIKSDILNISENKPTHKEFSVRLKKPLKPRQRNRSVIIEYDWEEPERTFFYKVPTACKSFTYNFSIPKGIEIKNRVLKVDTELGYKPTREALGQVIDVFAAADVTNPDGSTGITLHIQLDENLGFHQDTIVYGTTGNPLDPGFYEIKNQRFGKASERDQSTVDLEQYFTSKRQVFHYALFAHDYAASVGGPATGSSGHAEIFGNDVLVTLGTFTNNAGNDDENARTLMHELGHNLGLDHGGNSSDLLNCKPNYLSIMSYAHQFDSFNTGNSMDYSRSALSPIVENSLDEIAGLSQSTPTTLQGVFSSDGSNHLTGALSSTANPIDWNQLGGAVDNPVTVNINNLGGPCPVDDLDDSVMNGYDDWANISLNFRGGSEFSDGAFTSFDVLSEQGGTATFAATGPHAAPFVNSITAPLDAFNVNTIQDFSATFVDPVGVDENEVEESYAASIDWGDGTESVGDITIDQMPDDDDLTAEGTITASHEYTKSGKYQVSVTVTAIGAPATHTDTSTYPLWIMVYDDTGKKSDTQIVATSSMASSEGAYKDDLSLAGTVDFNFKAQYTPKGDATGSANVILSNDAGDEIFTLKSNKFIDWFLINKNVDGTPDEGYIQGIGEINGLSGDYGFTASVVDGNPSGGNGIDLVRIRIYEDPATPGSQFDNSKIIYDNMCTNLDPNIQPIQDPIDLSYENGECGGDGELVCQYAQTCAFNYERVFSDQTTSSGTVGLKDKNDATQEEALKKEKPSKE